MCYDRGNLCGVSTGYHSASPFPLYCALQLFGSTHHRRIFLQCAHQPFSFIFVFRLVHLLYLSLSSFIFIFHLLYLSPTSFIVVFNFFFYFYLSSLLSLSLSSFIFCLLPLLSLSSTSSFIFVFHLFHLLSFIFISFIFYLCLPPLIFVLHLFSTTHHIRIFLRCAHHPSLSPRPARSSISTILFSHTPHLLCLWPHLLTFVPFRLTLLHFLANSLQNK